MSIKSKLLSNKALYPFIMALKSCKDSETRERIWGLRHDKDEIVVKHLGEERTGKIIYNINLNDEYGGFFALLRWVCTALVYSDKRGFIPFVKLGDKCKYFDPDVKETGNVFEYYFKPVSSVLAGDVAKAANVVNYETKHLMEVRSDVSFQLDSSIVDMFADIWQKYIRINEKTKIKLNTDIASAVDNNKKTIAVHYRGTDFKLQYSGHPVAIDIQEEIDVIKELIDKEGYERVFLATDEKTAIDAFRDHFGDIVFCYSDTYRSQDGTAVHDSKDSRLNHKYLLGYEVLRDTLTMASCDALVAGVSNVSFFAMVINKAVFKPYEVCRICYHGMNSNANVYAKKNS